MSIRIPRSWIFWATLSVTWFVTLWFLSSGPIDGPRTFEIPHLDKIGHFGYFFGGAGLLSATLYRFNPSTVSWKRLIWTVMIVLTCVGILDEWHQSWVPERSGNDPADLTADILGAFVGTLVFLRLHRLIN